MQLRIALLTLLLCLSVFTNAQNKNDTTAITAAKAWWQATTFGDTAYLKAHSTDQLTVTFNSGRSFTHSQIIAQVATHNPSAPIRAEWSNVLQQRPAPQTAIVTNRVVEKVGNTRHVYKFMTVLVSVNSVWKVAAAQSTREIELAPTVAATESGKPEDFAGSYRTPGGINLKTVVRDSSLVLVEPSGAETKLAAIGQGLFEIPKILSAGNVRFSFSRNAAGQVTSMIRIAHNITTMRRVE
jgi:hypothetical protein